MASLRARHTRRCPCPSSTAAQYDRGKVLAPEGCECEPVWNVVIRQGRQTVWVKVGKDKTEAKRRLDKLSSEVNEGAFRPVANIGFDEWADRWLAGLERKASTVLAYRSTMDYGRKGFGHRQVRSLQPSDVVTMSLLMKEAGAGDSTRAKHLRVMHACLAAAIAHGYAARNPVAELPKSERPRPEKKEAAYFENGELGPLFAEIPDGLWKTMFLVTLKTGMRQGEVIALTWRDVDFVEAVIRVRQSYTGGHLTTPKNHERRDVDLQPDLVTVLANWKNELGDPPADALVFPGNGKDGFFHGSGVTKRVLYPAMTRAGIDRIGPTGEKRTFHSLRHTFAKIALENGAQLTWLQRHLGHGSLAITAGVYGHWERGERKKQAAIMEGAFNV